VHLSFVRSVTMDKWKDTELDKMKAGGNTKANAFFRSQPDYREGMSISEKYHTKAAALFRDKISTEAAGETWSEATSSAKDYKAPSSTVGNLGGSSSSGGGGMRSNASMSNNSSSGGINSMDDLEGFLGKSKGQISAEKDDYFQRKLNENQNKRDDLPPSQGGKYVGFGSSPAPQSSAANTGWDSTLSTLQDGWNVFSLGAQQFASVATEKAAKLGTKMNENVIKPASNKAQEFGSTVSQKATEGTLANDVQGSLKGAAAKVTDLSYKGWSGLQSYLGYDAGDRTNGSQSIASSEASSYQGGYGGQGVTHHGVSNVANTKLQDSGNGSFDEGWGNDDWGNGATTKKPELKLKDDDGWNNDSWADTTPATRVSSNAETASNGSNSATTSPRPKKTETHQKKKSFGADELEEWLNA